MVNSRSRRLRLWFWEIVRPRHSPRTTKSEIVRTTPNNSTIWLFIIWSWFSGKFAYFPNFPKRSKLFRIFRISRIFRVLRFCQILPGFSNFPGVFRKISPGKYTIWSNYNSTVIPELRLQIVLVMVFPTTEISRLRLRLTVVVPELRKKNSRELHR